MITPANILAVIIGGGIGSLCRYLFSLLASRIFGGSFAWGTLGANLAGCLLIGIGYALMERNIMSPAVRLFCMTGFLGGFTTFSTYSLESINFLTSGQFSMALTNIAVNNIGGLMLVVFGIWLGRMV